ncbi:MAG: hypothetical protein JRH20_10155 [Deltaproteobacteria bacterium]|nr:hypothetical protein [Deltaproteobacteria bacterium]
MSLGALRSAVALAAALGAEIIGAFVEDTDLLSFSALPFATLTGSLSPRKVRMGQAELGRAMRGQASHCREALAREAGAQGVAWSFRVLRGNVGKELNEASRDADLLSLGRAGISARRHSCGGFTAHASRSAPLVLIQKDAHLGSEGAPVVVLTLPGERASPLLQVAAVLAAAQGRALKVIAPEGAHRSRFRRRAEELLSRWALELHWIFSRPRGTSAALVEALTGARGGVLVIDADNPWVDDRRMAALVDRSGFSLMILR